MNRILFIVLAVFAMVFTLSFTGCHGHINGGIGTDEDIQFQRNAFVQETTPSSGVKAQSIVMETTVLPV